MHFFVKFNITSPFVVEKANEYFLFASTTDTQCSYGHRMRKYSRIPYKDQVDWATRTTF